MAKINMDYEVEHDRKRSPELKTTYLTILGVENCTRRYSFISIYIVHWIKHIERWEEV